MISGGLSTSEAVAREERTALFLGLAGCVAQRRLGSSEVSSRKLYKLLANAIWDWHFLSVHPSGRFVFPGIGDLVWVPHLFGGIGQVVPSIHRDDLELRDGLFVAIAQLSDVGLYVDHGLLGAESGAGGVEFRFAPFIPLDVRERSLVQRHEQYYWEELINLYAQFDDETLDAMASCRAPSATLYCLLAQMIRWRRHVAKALSALEEGRARDVDVDQHFERARFCTHQFFVKVEYWRNIDRYRATVSAAAVRTDFATIAPCIGDNGPQSLVSFQLAALLDVAEAFHAIHYVCRQVQLRIRRSEVSSAKLEGELRLLGAFVARSEAELCAPEPWHALFYAGPDNELASKCLILVHSVFDRIAERIRHPIPRQKDFYRKFIELHYPLPRAHFEPGF